MCVEQLASNDHDTFDPTRCPLLQDLDPEEVERLMATDPRIRACRGAVESGRITIESCVTRVEASGRRKKPARKTA